METMQGLGTTQDIECREAVQEWGNLNDWHHAIGSGPFILNDFISDSSLTLVRNPNYWGHDERYPQNQLPYLDKINILIIPDDATALAAMRTAKIDAIQGLSLQSTQQLQKTNPEIVQIGYPDGSSESIDPRNDKAPFNDIRVREAMQMALDLPTIASTYYDGTCSPDPSSMTANYVQGWGFPYDQWPQDLKDQYAYNPTAAKQLLAAAGYPNGFKTDLVADSAGDMDLMQIVKSYFAAVGIDMSITPMDNASWLAFVQQGHKQDALAYRPAPSGTLGVSYDFFHMLLQFRTGYGNNYRGVSDPVYDAFYTEAEASTTEDQMKTIIKNMNEYVAEQHFSISLLTPEFYAVCQPWLKGFDGQDNSIASNAMMLGFYGARFWIDQNLKESMGY